MSNIYNLKLCQALSEFSQFPDVSPDSSKGKEMSIIGSVGTHPEPTPFSLAPQPCRPLPSVNAPSAVKVIDDVTTGRFDLLKYPIVIVIATRHPVTPPRYP
jgi:hypothetical protein